MIEKQYIKDFEKLGFGMFVHFGLYSLIGKGEWAKDCLQISDQDYEPLAKRFNPKPDWANQLVSTAKNAGCKYITLTTRHHDGFSLFDTCGLSDYDAPCHCGRDLVREFVNACRAEDIIPFFYHTLLDWHETTFDTDFSAYLKYLRASVEILCKNYGEIGGLWFDGMWSKPDAEWEEDALYAIIRKYQPEVMIINNTGMAARGKLGNIELDSVTFERGKPQAINLDDSPKYIASEMCEIMGDHWGYAMEDLNYKSPAKMIEQLCECRKFGSNMLLNVGPDGDGRLRLMDEAILALVGQWVSYFDEAIRSPGPTNILVENKKYDFILQDQNNYYLFCFELPMLADPNVAMFTAGDYEDRFMLSKKINAVYWMDTNEKVRFTQDSEQVTVYTQPFRYGRNLVVRVAKISTVNGKGYSRFPLKQDPRSRRTCPRR